MRGVQIGEPLENLESGLYVPRQDVFEKPLNGIEDEDLLPQSPGVDIANAIVPNSEFGGLVLVNGQLELYEQLAVQFSSDDEVVILPTSTADVSLGKVMTESVTVRFTSESTFCIAGLAINRRKHPWQVDAISQIPGRASMVGELVTKVFGSLDLLPTYEIKEADSEDGIHVAKKLPQYF